MKLKWHRNKEELPINSHPLVEKPAIHHAIIQAKDTQFIPTTTNTSDHMSMANAKEMANISTPMVIGTKGLLLQIKNMGLEDLPVKIKVNTMVHIQ